MKSLNTFQKPLLNLMIALLTIMLPSMTFGQTEGSGNVQKQNRSLPPFTQIEVGSAFTVKLNQGEPNVIIETDDNLNNLIETLVDNGVLTINSSGIKNPTSLKVYITAPDITNIELSGAARVESTGVLNFPKLNLSASGASRANLELNTEELNTEVSGASRVTLKGYAANHNSEVSGASSVNAMMLKTITTTSEVSGAARMSVYAKTQLITDITAAGTLTYFDNPDIKKLKQSGESIINLNNPDDAMPVIVEEEGNKEEYDNFGIKVFEDGDSTNVKVGKILNVEVSEDDETKIDIGNHQLEIDDEGNVTFKKNSKEKYDGHWGGVEIGINGLLSSDNSFNMEPGYEFLDQKMEKSINLDLNLFEQNYNIINENFGFTTGLGLEWNNYRFKDNAVLYNLNDTLRGFLDTDVNKEFIKSKLVTTYLTLPVMFEFQTNHFSKSNSFHIGVGLLNGLRIGTHTKAITENGKRATDKNYGASSMNPFKVDLMARIGWGKVNLYGKYSLTELFKEGRGPELTPFSIGICLVNW